MFSFRLRISEMNKPEPSGAAGFDNETTPKTVGVKEGEVQ